MPDQIVNSFPRIRNIHNYLCKSLPRYVVFEFLGIHRRVKLVPECARITGVFRLVIELGQFRYLHFAMHVKGNSVTAFDSQLVLSQDQPKDEINAGEP